MGVAAAAVIASNAVKVVIGPQIVLTWVVTVEDHCLKAQEREEVGTGVAVASSVVRKVIGLRVVPTWAGRAGALAAIAMVMPKKAKAAHSPIELNAEFN